MVTPTRESKNLENQLTNEQQRLNRLSSDGHMTTEEKEKELREIQRQIAELNRKLNQERLEEKEKAREAAIEQEQKKVIKEELSDLHQKEKLQIQVLYPHQEKNTPNQNPGSKIIIRE